MYGPTLLPIAIGIRLIQIQPHPGCITVIAATTPYAARCPICHGLSRRVHSRYVRLLADLPLRRVPVRIELHARRFFCSTPGCRRHIFTERIPGLVQPHHRRTSQLDEALCLIGMALGGECGSRVAGELLVGISADTLLRLLRHSHAGALRPTSPKVLGVDDWAYRKGKQYGTIVVDLEEHRVVDVLSDRAVGSWSGWLQQHPGVVVVSRDRGDIYAKGTDIGAPMAVQVADRWHLHHNLVETVHRIVERHHGKLRTIVKQAADSLAAASAPSPFTPALTPSPMAGAAAEVAQPSSPAPSSPAPAAVSRPGGFYKTETSQDRERRDLEQRYRERYDRVITLRQQGLSIRAISRLTGLNRRTIIRLLNADAYPGVPARGRSPRAVAGFEEYLRRRWHEGMRSVTGLLNEIRAQGYRGTYAALWGFVRALLTDTPDVLTLTMAPSSRVSAEPSVRSTTWWLLGKSDRLTAEQRAWLEVWLAECPQIQVTRNLAVQFESVLRDRNVAKLDQWLFDASASDIAELQRFAEGLRSDYAAVAAGVSLGWSNGQTEGQVNRLKLIKRMMYGRAKVDLLRIRVMNRV